MPTKAQIAVQNINIEDTEDRLNDVESFSDAQIARYRQIIRDDREVKTEEGGAVIINQRLPGINPNRTGTVSYNQLKAANLYSYFNRNIINELNMALENTRRGHINSVIAFKIQFIPAGYYELALTKNYKKLADNTFDQTPGPLHKPGSIGGNIYTNSYLSKSGFLYSNQIKGAYQMKVDTITKTMKIPKRQGFDALREALIEFATNLTTENYNANIWWFAGFKIVVPASVRNPNFTDFAQRLRAYDVVSNKAFQNMTQTSTSVTKNCIYQTYRFLYHDDKLLAKNASTIDKALKQEKEEVIEYVQNGELINFMKSMSEKIDEPMYVEFFNKNIEFDNVYGIKVFKDEVSEISDLRDFNGQKVFLYDNEHVQPRKNVEYKNKNPKDKTAMFKLAAKKCINTYRTQKVIIAFDIESYDDGTQKPFCINVYGDNGIDSSFYGEDCVKLFVDFLEPLVVRLNENKSHEKEKVTYYYIYGYNNASYDNILIFEELQKRFKLGDKGSSYICTGNSFKMINIHNIKIYDLMCYYAGGLAYNAKCFKLDENKLTFPHRFMAQSTIKYVGAVPEIEFWNSEGDRQQYIDNFGEQLDVENYCRNHYCKGDVIIAYQIAKKHLENAIMWVGDHKKATKEKFELGKGKKLVDNADYRLVDVSDCPTAASMSMKLFSYLFLEEDLYCSPQEEMERAAYLGGRTEVFIKKFDGDKDNFLTYVDFNSSYPYCMTKLMPVKYLNHVDYEEEETDDIIDYYLYDSRVEYQGDNKHYIPNCLYRAEEGDIIATKNSPWFPRWGVELNRAIKDGCKVFTRKMVTYEARPIFKEFIDRYYNERLACKKTNPSKAQFLKTLINSLYGKTGQNIKSHHKLCLNDEQLIAALSTKGVMLENMELFDDGRTKIKYHDDKIDEKTVGHLVRFASYITASAREHLAEAASIIGHENVYYCDTDSLIYGKCNNPEALDKELDNKILGKLKKEDYSLAIDEKHYLLDGSYITVDKAYSDEYKIVQAYFLAPKTYSYKYMVNIGAHKLYNSDDELIGEYEKGDYIMGSYRSKGIREKDMRIEYYDEIYDKQYSDDKSVAILNPSMFIRTLSSIKVIPMYRHISCVYNKRIWTGDTSEAYDTVEDWHSAKYL